MALDKILKGAATNKTTGIIPASFLESESAVPCLVEALKSLKPQVNSPIFDPDVRRSFMTITAALRTMISQAEDVDKASGKQDATRRFISEFRKYDDLDLDTTWVLTYGVRNEDSDVRLNSLLILANVIDNSTLCLPLDHLYDPTLGDTPYGKRGRANLLTIVSVVAPWAYYENYNDIEKTVAFVSTKIGEAQDLTDTSAILQNIKDRLAVQTSTSNKAVPIPANSGKNCRQYKLRWASGLSF